MSNIDGQAFRSVFRAAYEKCFGTSLKNPLTETESKHFSNKLFDATGLVVGAKSLKNYSAFILGSNDSKQENPSAATLDTLARYVLEAPYTDELYRKEREGHFPYWFKYRSGANPLVKAELIEPKRKRKWGYAVAGILIIISVALILLRLYKEPSNGLFVEDFNNVDNDSLTNHGWVILSKDNEWWNRRNEQGPGITLYTLRGDNWPDSINKLGIKNLMIRKLESDCFSAELHFENFMPFENWQQAGILLMEDTTFTGKSVRVSIGYNDYFGGYARPKEIIIQGLSSSGKDVNKPEEIAHIPLFTMERSPDSLVRNNLKYAALRIEKEKDRFRFLYSASPVKNFALKEAFIRQISIEPKYIGIFALQGFVNSPNHIPVHITFFSIARDKCN